MNGKNRHWTLFKSILANSEHILHHYMPQHTRLKSLSLCQAT